MREHTPGPWEQPQYWWHIAGPMDEPVAQIELSDDPVRDKANAALITAAPELLEACVLLLERLEREGTGAKETWAAIDYARDKIGKVRGLPRDVDSLGTKTAASDGGQTWSEP